MYRGKKIAELSKKTNKNKENKPTTRLRFQDFNNAESNVVDFQNKWCPEGSVHQYQDEAPPVYDFARQVFFHITILSNFALISSFSCRFWFNIQLSNST